MSTLLAHPAQALLFALIFAGIVAAFVMAGVEFVREYRADRAYRAHVEQALAVTR